MNKIVEVSVTNGHGIVVDQTSSTPLDLLIMQWIDAKTKRSGSQKTNKAYLDTIDQFRAALHNQGIDLDSTDDQALKLIALTAQAFASWSARGKAVASATINQRLAILSSFYSFAIRQSCLSANPIDRVERAKVQAYASVTHLTSDQTAHSLAAIDRSTLVGKRDYALLVILLQTGRRLAEVEALEVSDLVLLVGKITVTFKRCKGGKTMTDTLPFAVTNALVDWLEAFYGHDLQLGNPKDTRPLWVSLVDRKNAKGTTSRGDKLGGQSIADICQKHLGTSKVHITRHTWAHQMDDLGAQASVIQSRLGHESLATTGRYLARLKSAENPFSDRLAAGLGIE